MQAFRHAGADGCTVHVEVGDTAELLAEAKRLGLRAGLAVNPETPYEAVGPFLDQADLILCTTVHPGFGGQSFIEDVVPKVARVRAELDRRGLSADLEVDGGPDEETALTVVRAGARVLVAGSAVFDAPAPLGSRPQNSRGRDGCTSRRVNPIRPTFAKIAPPVVMCNPESCPQDSRAAMLHILRTGPFRPGMAEIARGG